MKNLIKNKKGQSNVIILAIFVIVTGFALLTVGNYLLYAIANSADASTLIASRGAQASGTYTFNGTNISDSRTGGFYPVNVTITNGAAVYNFEFNTTTVGNPTCFVSNCVLVNVTNTNNSAGAASALRTAINANASVGTFAASSVSGNTTTVTYASRTTSGNTVVLSDDSPSFESDLIVSAGLSGGLNDVTGATSQNSIMSYIGIVMPLFGLAMMLLGFGVILYTMRNSLGNQEQR